MKPSELSESICLELAEKAALLAGGKLKPEPPRRHVMLRCRDGVVRPRTSGPIRTFEEFVKYFWSMVDKTGECWNWKGYRHKGELKYGVVMWKRAHLLAHRAAYSLGNGPIKKGMFICHTCDNPSCVNPSHLFQGTNSDNIRDCIKKGRKNPMHGESHNKAKLSSTDVVEIRNTFPVRTITQVEFAKQWGVSRAAIYHIIRRDSWKSVK